MRILCFCLTLLFFALSFAPSAIACTRDEAFNKMMAIGRAQRGIMTGAAGNHAKMQSAADLAKEVGDVGKILAAEKYTEACEYYDKIARKYNIDLDEASKGMITMDQIRKDGGRKGGACSQADASKKLMGLMQDLQDKVALGDEPASTHRSFANDVQKHNDLMSTNPSAFCAKLDELNKQYKIR